MTDIILRSYPENKYDRYNEYRYNRNDFKKYTEINKSRNDYEKWMEGINYKTNRKIQIGGRTHCKLGYEKSSCLIYYICKQYSKYLRSSLKMV